MAAALPTHAREPAPLDGLDTCTGTGELPLRFSSCTFTWNVALRSARSEPFSVSAAKPAGTTTDRTPSKPETAPVVSAVVPVVTSAARANGAMHPATTRAAAAATANFERLIHSSLP